MSNTLEEFGIGSEQELKNAMDHASEIMNGVFLKENERFWGRDWSYTEVALRNIPAPSDTIISSACVLIGRTTIPARDENGNEMQDPSGKSLRCSCFKVGVKFIIQTPRSRTAAYSEVVLYVNPETGAIVGDVTSYTARDEKVNSKSIDYDIIKGMPRAPLVPLVDWLFNHARRIFFRLRWGHVFDMNRRKRDDAEVEAKNANGVETPASSPGPEKGADGTQGAEAR